MPLRTRRTGTTRKLLVFGVTVLVIATLIGWEFLGRAKNDDKPSTSSPEAEPIFVPAPVTLAPGLHLLGALSPSVAYVIETSDGLILVDTGLADSHQLLLQQFRALKLDVGQLKRILITHGHGDHYLGAMKLKELTGARIYAGRGDSDVLRQAGPREAVFSTFPMDDMEIPPTTVDVELDGGETIELGDTRVEVIATPGHTPGSVCYLLERNGRTALFSGDTIMTITGDLGTYATYLPPRYRGDAGKFLESLRKLEKLPKPDLLLPGHPRTDQQMISARITPGVWSSLLSRGIRQMEELTARYAEDGSDFLDGHPKELLDGLHYLGDLAGFALYCCARESKVILFDAPGGPELIPFLEQRLPDAGLELAMITDVVLTEADADWATGLEPLVAQTGCRVIAAVDDHQTVTQFCPDATVITPADVALDYDWFTLTEIRFEGFGEPRTAYQFPWQEKRVLVTGRIPLKFTRESLQEMQNLKFDARKFQQSLGRLNNYAPDVWLPARPVHGQNANLYDNDWPKVVRECRLSLGLGF